MFSSFGGGCDMMCVLCFNEARRRTCDFPVNVVGLVFTEWAVGY